MSLGYLNTIPSANISRINSVAKSSIYSMDTVVIGTTGFTSLISSIQRVEIQLTGNILVGSASITPVNRANSAIIMSQSPLGSHTIATEDEDQSTSTMLTVEFSSDSQVIATRNSLPFACVVSASAWVVEFNSSKITTIQTGSLTIGASSASIVATLPTSIDKTKAIILNNGSRGLGNNAPADHAYCSQIVSLVDSTTIRGNRGLASANTSICNYTIIEFATGVLNSAPQQVTVTGSASGTDQTVTISAVDASQSICFPRGLMFLDSLVQSNADCVYLTLTDSTTVTGVHNTAGATGAISETITEFVSGSIKSIQRGTITLPNTSTTSVNATVNAVDTSKSILLLHGSSGTSAGSLSTIDEVPNGKIIDSTTIQAYRGLGVDRQCIVSYELIEFN